MTEFSARTPNMSSDLKSLDTPTSSSNDFRPMHVIVLSEMSAREKEKYYTMLMNCGAKFYPHPLIKPTDTHNDQNDIECKEYIANLRILAPGVIKQKKSTGAKNGKTSADTTSSTPPGARLARLAEAGGQINVNISGVKQFDYTPYIRFVSIIASENDTWSPKPRILSWLVKLIEELYDHRFLHERSDVERDNSELAQRLSSSAEVKLQQQVFPVFIYKRMSTTLGLRHIVEQSCWDILYNTDRLRRDYLEVEIFARFLQEFYDQDDLLFFLYVRSVIANVLHINFRGRWSKLDGPGRQTPLALWMSHRECVQVARIVFGATNDTLCKEFLALITPHMVGKKDKTNDSSRIDITQFLHLAVVGYHQTQSDNGNASTYGGSPKRFSNYGPGAHAPYSASVAGDPQVVGSSLDAYLQMMNSGNGAGSGISLSALASSPIQLSSQTHLMDSSSAGPNWATSPTDTAINGDSEAMNEFEQVLAERQGEFLQVLCAPLDNLLRNSSLTEDAAQSVLLKIIDMLKVKIDTLVPNPNTSNIDAYDAQLRQALNNPTLSSEMARYRDNLLQSY